MDLAISPQYINQINQFPFLTQDEEFSLAKRFVEHNDLKAAERLVLSHLRLVVKISKKYQTYGIPLNDLISEGTIGLMTAVKKFDPYKGYRLATYAMWWIKAYIQEYILQSWSLVKIGTTSAQRKLFYNLRKIKNRLRKVDNTALSYEHVKLLSSELNVTEKEVLEMDSRLSAKDKSLNDQVHTEDTAYELIDVMPSNSPSPEALIIKKDYFEKKKQLLNVALNILTEREQNVIKLRYLSEVPKTQGEIAKKYGVSFQRIQKIEETAMQKIKNYVSENALEKA